MGVDHAQQPWPVVSLRDDVDPALADERDEPLAQQRVVLGHDYAHGSSARIVVPPGGASGRRREAPRWSR